MIGTQKKATFFAFLAAILYAINSPVSKLLLEKVPTTMMAAFFLNDRAYHDHCG